MTQNIGHAKLLRPRLFLENVEVDLVALSLSATEGDAATATISIIPANSALNFEARTKVTVTFWNEDIDPPRDCLLFTGELLDIGYDKSGFGSRNISLICRDDSTLWDTSYLYSLRYSPTSAENVVAGSTRNFLGLSENANPFDDILKQPEQVIRDMIQKQKSEGLSLNSPEGLLGGLLNVLDLLGGIPGKYVGINAWSTIQEARVRLMDQLGTDSGGTASTLFDATAFDNWLLSRVGDAGTVISFRELVQMIGQYVYYSVVPNPVARYIAGERRPPAWPTDSDNAPRRADSTGLDPELVPYRDAILNELRKKWDGKALPLAVQTAGYRTAEDQARLDAKAGRTTPSPPGPHRYGVAVDFSLKGHGIGFLYNNKADPSGSLHQRLVYWAGKRYTPEDVYHAGGFTEDQVRNIKWLVEFYRDLRAAAELVSPPGVLTWGGSWRQTDPWLKMYGIGGDPVHVELTGWRGRQASALPSGSEAERKAKELLPKRERLITQIFRPDVWFVPPPACNIIFPEEQQAFSFSRQLMRETTRLQLSTHNAVIAGEGGADAVLSSVYFAPKIEGTQNLASGGLGTAAKAFIYPHEKYTGVIPKMERSSDLAFYSRLEEDSQLTDESVKAASEEELLSKTSNLLDQWADRTAAYNFLSYRYAARTVQITMPFTPRLVVGFPALVLERTAAEGSTAEQRVKSGFAPNHFIGMVRAVTHSLTQEGGTTQVTLSHVRTHKPTMDDLFAANAYENGGILSVQVRTAPSTHAVVVNSEMVADEYTFCLELRQRLAAGMSPSSPDPDLLGPDRYPIEGPIEVETADPGVVGAVGAVSATFPFSRVTLQTSVPKEYLPLEEAIRPPWVSDEYSNEKIGQLYQQLFGCGSIMDLYDLKPSTLKDIPFSGPSIADATEKLVQMYSRLSSGGYSATAFIREVTGRGYASLAEVIGTKDRPGFFWESCGNFKDLEGEMFRWMSANGPRDVPLTTQISQTSEENRVDPRLDPRQGRWLKVRAYVDEVLRSDGYRG